MKKSVKIIIIIAVILLSLAVISALVFPIGRNDEDPDGYKTASVNYSIAGISDEGEYEDVKTSFMNKDAIKADSVKVELDFDAGLKYQIFFYDDFDNFVSSTVVLSKGSEAEMPEGATCFRIEVTPVLEEEKELTVWDQHSYTGKIDVKIIETVTEDTEV